MRSKPITLSEEQRRELEKFTKTGVHSAKMITRAKTILTLDRSSQKGIIKIGKISKEVGITRQSVTKIKKAFLASGSVEEFLTRKKRETPPIQSKITGEVEAHIIALACSEPPEGCAKWTLRLLADKSVELNYIDSLSHMSVDRVLKKRSTNLI